MSVFKTLTIKGPEGMVRGFFNNRNLQGAPSKKHFPDIKSVAIVPKVFTDKEDAHTFLQEITQPGGNAAAARIPGEAWLIGAWLAVEDSDD